MFSPLYTPAKRRLSMADPFFDMGNAESAISFYTKQEPTSPSHSDISRQAHNSILQSAETPAIVCEQPPCMGTVLCPTLLAFERHYDQMHRYVCSLCNAILPSSYWLDLHIDEIHDAFFDVRAKRGDCMFRCFLASCPKAFANADDRKRHMVHTHCFAASFNWRLVDTGMRQSDESSQSMEIDAVVSVFKKSLRVSAPDAITFGASDSDAQQWP
ncbi:hypothetical protein J3B02_001676 [Coemansia erecta]|uniref:C2H2-type domain-containing protein n=1 Tax=Coemansia asiatica TaxID=1052880 RepID=A0A9W7XQA4_9FUNG|nr:hypothetical protein LPJ64_000777 [Coemansia asiatica]KAJ2856299.1 hypothetical protein J3B02_001676 [Coemansia erecta]KAJ2888158.1 hypothetical protein FB639_000830 [Coemansia asiatica]